MNLTKHILQLGVKVYQVWHIATDVNYKGQEPIKKLPGIMKISYSGASNTFKIHQERRANHFVFPNFVTVIILVIIYLLNLQRLYKQKLCGTMVIGYHYCTISFIKALTQVLCRFKSLFTLCWRFAMVGISDKGPAWKQGQAPFVGQPLCKHNPSSSSSTGWSISRTIQVQYCEFHPFDYLQVYKKSI